MTYRYCSTTVEAMTAEALIQSDGGGSGAITSADNITKVTTLGSDTELDLTAHNAWLFSPDEADSGTVGMGTGNGSDGSGAVVIYTGDGGSTGLIGISTGHAATGDSGGIGLQTGNSDNANSGGITLGVGTADGTRGDIVLSANAITSAATDGYLQIQSADQPAGASGDIYIFTGAPADGSNSGALNLGTGNNPGTGNSGDAYLYTGDANSGNSGNVFVQSGAAASGTRGSITIDGPMIKAGSAQWYGDVGFDFEVNNVDSTGDAGTEAKGVYLQAGICDTLGTGGAAWIQAGDGGSTGGNGGLAGMQAGQSTCAGATGGELHLVGGQAGATDAHGGAILIQSGQGQGTGNSGNITIQTGVVDTGTRGNVILGNLPTSDPGVVGALWMDPAFSFSLKVSQG